MNDNDCTYCASGMGCSFHSMEWATKRIKDLKRVIEIQRLGLVDVMEVDDRNESLTWDIADSALARADAILEGKVKE